MIELLLAAENALLIGLLDQAERTYRQVLDADPGNAIAAVGLARVALERGDEAGAHHLARAALALDPENASARRMIDRLEEVARHRAAPAPVPTADLPPEAAPVPEAAIAPETAPASEAAPDSAPPAPLSSTPRRSLVRRLLRRS